MVMNQRSRRAERKIQAHATIDFAAYIQTMITQKSYKKSKVLHSCKAKRDM